MTPMQMEKRADELISMFVKEKNKLGLGPYMGTARFLKWIPLESHENGGHWDLENDRVVREFTVQQFSLPLETVETMIRGPLQADAARRRTSLFSNEPWVLEALR